MHSSSASEGLTSAAHSRPTTAALSIIIPAFNEAGRIGESLASVGAHARREQRRIELIVVDDGSCDRTADIVRAFEQDSADSNLVQVRLIANERNLGKGASVRRGMLEATGAVLLMTDADMSTPIGEVNKLLSWLDQGYRIVIGSRDLPDSRLDPPQPRWRRLLAWAFRALRRRILLPDLRDTQCGFKCFERNVAQDVFALQTVDGWVFDCEVLGLARRKGYRIKEVGVVWRNDPRSRVRPLRDSVEALTSLLSIRRRLLRIAAERPADRSECRSRANTGPSPRPASTGPASPAPSRTSRKIQLRRHRHHND